MPYFDFGFTLKSDSLDRFDSFESTGLKAEIKKALGEMGFTSPTEVQVEAIPYALEGKDLIVRSKTGSGKTGAFAIPILDMLVQQPSKSGVHALVIAPTRELAIQISDVFTKIGKYTRIRNAIVYGGVSINPQADKIRSGASIVIGTPGRIIDLMERGMLDLSKIKFLVLDEADIMLEMGFIDDIKYIIENMPEKKQMMLFSATMPNRIKEVAYEYMHDIKNIEVGGEEELAVKKIQNVYSLVSKSSKFSALLAYLDEYKPKKAIVFSKTQRNTETLYRILSDNGFKPILLHGGITQAKREVALSRFRHVDGGLLIATNVAARGLDIVDVSGASGAERIKSVLKRYGIDASVELTEDRYKYAEHNGEKPALLLDDKPNVVINAARKGIRSVLIRTDYNRVAGFFIKGVNNLVTIAAPEDMDSACARALRNRTTA